jgi:hypothetical protein
VRSGAAEHSGGQRSGRVSAPLFRLAKSPSARAQVDYWLGLAEEALEEGDVGLARRRVAEAKLRCPEVGLRRSVLEASADGPWG